MELSKTYELERKFLLKQIPNIEYINELNIKQYYLQSKENIVKRIREVITDSAKYYYTEKIYDGLYTEEKEVLISREEFINFKENAVSSIEKVRKIYYDGNRNWEIDVFTNINLIIAELEFISDSSSLDKTNKKLNEYLIPDFIKNNMVLEITHMKDFSNAALSVLI